MRKDKREKRKEMEKEIKRREQRDKDQGKIEERVPGRWDKETGVNELRLYRRITDNQRHRGGKKTRVGRKMQVYVGGYEGKTRRRDVNLMRKQLELVRSRIAHRGEAKQPRWIVGTKGVLGQVREKRAKGKPEGRIYVTKEWESGCLTNLKKRTRFYNKLKMPGRRRFRHTQEHGVARAEAVAAGIPTAGVFQADGKEKRREKRTYVIPGNENTRMGGRRRGYMAALAYEEGEVLRKEGNGEIRREGEEEIEEEEEKTSKKTK